MRIIAGHYKNRHIDFTKLKIRPTTNFAKESLFNILNNRYDFKKLSVLDLFSGSGNISYEFVSRGCQAIVAIDKNINCIKFIKKIKQQFEMHNLHVKLTKVNKYLTHGANNYDVIFADPPYNYKQDEYNEIITLVFEKNLLLKYGMLIIEHSKFIKFDNNPFFFEKRKYGSVNFTFFKND